MDASDAFIMSLPAPTFDLDSWTSNYDGPLLPYRLLHLAVRCPPLARQSLQLALQAATNGKDTSLYLRVLHIADLLGFTDLSKEDANWRSRQDEANRRELARLEGELKGYKNNLIRESIRMGQEDLANHLLSTGGPPPDPSNPASQTTSGYHAAYQAFGKMRDYCTTPTHVAAMTLRLLFTALLHATAAQQANASAVIHLNSALQNAGRLRSTGVKEEEASRLTPIMHVSSGIAHLQLGHYDAAAIAFLATPPDYATLGAVHGLDFPRAVASGNDIAIYGGLCALATLDRDALLTNVLGGPFRAFLELEPHMRKALSLYTTAKYQACLATLQHYHSDWSCDLFLGSLDSTGESHVDRLFARIRQRSMTAYFASFSQVSLSSLASTFPPSHLSAGTDATAAMEEELLTLIENGSLDARIDVVNGTLIAPQRAVRAETHAKARATADEVERTLLLRLHKINVSLAGLEVPKVKAGWGAGDGVRVGNGG